MTQRQARKMLRTETEIVALDPGSYALFLSLALDLMYHGEMINCRITPGYKQETA